VQKSLKFYVLALSFLATQAQAGLIDELTPAEKAVVENGQQVVRQVAVAGSVWPKVVVYQRLDATPEEAAAVMFDYDRHKEFYEGMTKSKAANPGALETDIDYVMTFPRVLGISLPDEVYTVRDTLVALGESGYEISWKMVKASSMNDTSGSSRFEKMGSGTLLRYTNFINPPKPALAKLIVKMAIERVKDSAKDLSKRIALERSTMTDLLGQQKATLAKALGR
jgi:hypothetical protein